MSTSPNLTNGHGSGLDGQANGSGDLADLPGKHNIQEQQLQYEAQQQRFQAAKPQLVATSVASSKSASGNTSPVRAKSELDLRMSGENFNEHKSNGSTQVTQLALWNKQQQELQQLQEEEDYQQQLLQNHFLSNGNDFKHPVYNTRIRHGFEADYESEQYMTFLAEVRSLSIRANFHQY